MKSPFPGMDPFIEASGLWEDFHNHLVEAIAATLADTIPRHYFVKSGERAYDVVSLRSLVSEPFRETFVEIYKEAEDRELVTCIELLSPSNKRFGTEGWEQYLRKRQALLLGQANLVEIDLLRGGRKMPMHDRWPECPYTILVSSRQRAPYCRVWKAWSRKPLPSFKVPLLSSDPDAELALQPLVDAIYHRYRYEAQIAYSKPCKPPLSEEDSLWLQEQLKSRGGEPNG